MACHTHIVYLNTFFPKGYDVWLGNVRGNTYSLRHEKYNVKSSAFWNFSFDEMAKFDLPSMLMYVLNVTKEEQLYYVGHSQGTMIIFAGDIFIKNCFSINYLLVCNYEER